MNQKNTVRTVLRILLALLILLNMGLIFFFSSQTAEISSALSGSIAENIAQNTIPNFEQKPQEEQKEIVSQMQHPLRKFAHVAEFGLLGALTFLFLLTWKKHFLLKYLSTLAFVTLYAMTDEFHQLYSFGRGPSAKDVLLDLLGAVILCTPILLVAFLLRTHRESKRLDVTDVHLVSQCQNVDLRIAVAADLHNNDPARVISRLAEHKPDLILVPGDLMEDRDFANENSNGYAFLRAAAAIAPTYYSLGNHEIGCYHKGNPWRHPIPTPLSETARARIAATGAILLDDACVRHGEWLICGLTSGINGAANRPDEQALERFAAAEGEKILLCHHPEYYVPHVRDKRIALTVCGHAHGGHWRIYQRGVYSPGQGLFPKYTSGVIDGRCVISRGLGNHTWIPRICNVPELILIHYKSAQEPSA